MDCKASPSESGQRRVCAAARPATARLAVTLLAALLATGCTQIGNLKARLAGEPSTQSSAPAATAPAREASAAPSLRVIVNDELERGRYAEGEQALRRYIAQHPGDRQARLMLRQLTADPEQMLGHASRPYVVRSGDSFSALAARYLGDSNLFLILARYNHSSNPSQLDTGETIRLPTSVPRVTTPADATLTGAQGADQRAGTAAPSTPSRTPAPISKTAATQAAQLQAESVALLDRGQKAQALTRLDQALDLDPHLPPGNSKSASLRQQLLGNYHQRAVILYRDQHLDQAIALWNHVLAIDPGYEPAVIYRARALELKARLKQF